MIRLTNEQWERIRNHFPEEHIPDGRPGRRPISTRRVFEAVLWILNTGAQWHMLPQSYPNYKSVHRRFQTWCRDEVLRRVLMDVANELRDKGALDEAECFIDATFVMATFAGSTTPAISSALSSLPASLFSSNDFETGSEFKELAALLGPLAFARHPAVQPFGALRSLPRKQRSKGKPV